MPYGKVGSRLGFALKCLSQVGNFLPNFQVIDSIRNIAFIRVLRLVYYRNIVQSGDLSTLTSCVCYTTPQLLSKNPYKNEYQSGVSF